MAGITHEIAASFGVGTKGGGGHRTLVDYRVFTEMSKEEKL